MKMKTLKNELKKLSATQMNFRRQIEGRCTIGNKA